MTNEELQNLSLQTGIPEDQLFMIGTRLRISDPMLFQQKMMSLLEFQKRTGVPLDEAVNFYSENVHKVDPQVPPPPGQPAVTAPTPQPIVTPPVQLPTLPNPVQPPAMPQAAPKPIAAPQDQPGVALGFDSKFQQGYKFKPSDGSNDLGGQCAWFAQQVTRLPDGSNWTIGNSVAEKQQQLATHAQSGNAYYPGQGKPEVGQSIVFGNGKYGHVAVINEILPDGRLKLTESNYDNNLSVRHDRVIDPTDPLIVGFVKTKPVADVQPKNPAEMPQPKYEPQSEQKAENNAAKGRQEATIQEQAVQPPVQPKPEDIKQEVKQEAGQDPGSKLYSQDLEDKIVSQLPQEQQANARRAIPEIAQALKDENILTPKTLAYAVATAGHESNFVPKEEIMANPNLDDKNAYIAKLQDGYSGGKDYRGRGYIQLTHDYNYKKFGDRIGVDLVKNPDQLLDPKVSAKVLAAYMKDNGVADAANNEDYVNARVRVQGRGATNQQFMPTTQAIGEQAKKITGAIGDNIDQYLSKKPEDQAPTDAIGQITQETAEKQDQEASKIVQSENIGEQTAQEKISQGVEQPDIMSTAQKTANETMETPIAKEKGKGFLDVFAQGQKQVKSPILGATEKAISATQEQNNPAEGANKNILQNYAQNISGQTEQAVAPEAQKQQFQKNLQTGNVLFSSALNKSSDAKQVARKSFQDPVGMMKNALSSTASNVVDAAKNAVGETVSRVARAAKERQPVQASNFSNNVSQSFSQNRSSQAQATPPKISAPTNKPVSQSFRTAVNRPQVKNSPYNRLPSKSASKLQPKRK